MAKLVLKLDNVVQTEVPLDGVVSIGRLPDNTLAIDNPGVSSRHCRVVCEDGHYFVEDNNSKNGTFVNEQRVTRVQLIDGDELTFGRHTVAFVDAEVGTETKKLNASSARNAGTVTFETGKGQELLDIIKSSMASGIMRPTILTPATSTEPVGTLTVLRGKTDKPQYVLTRRMFLIGKSDTAALRLKGFFAPKSAAVINCRAGKYFVAPAQKSVKVKLNEACLAEPQELNEGDILEVAKVKLTFSYRE